MVRKLLPHKPPAVPSRQSRAPQHLPNSRGVVHTPREGRGELAGATEKGATFLSYGDALKFKVGEESRGTKWFISMKLSMDQMLFPQYVGGVEDTHKKTHLTLPNTLQHPLQACQSTRKVASEFQLCGGWA